MCNFLGRIIDTNHPFIYEGKPLYQGVWIDVFYLLHLSHLQDLGSSLHSHGQYPTLGLQHFSLGLLHQPPNSSSYLSSPLSPVRPPYHCQCRVYATPLLKILYYPPSFLKLRTCQLFQLSLSLHLLLLSHIRHSSHAKLHLMPEYIKSFDSPASST